MEINDYQENYTSGWIKLYRSIEKSGFYHKSAYVHLWVHLLLKATHEKTEFLHNGMLKKLKPGQLLTGRNRLSQETGIPPSSIERILNTFESGQMIGQAKDSHNRVITILNWGQYQKTDSKTDRQRTDSGQTADTFKNVKNDKEEYIRIFSTEDSWKQSQARIHQTTVVKINDYLEAYLEMLNYGMIKNESDIKFGFNKWMKGESPKQNQSPTKIAL